MAGMISGNRLIVVMPAYNAERTLRQTYDELPHEYVDEIILVDDASRDATADVAREPVSRGRKTNPSPSIRSGACP